MSTNEHSINQLHPEEPRWFAIYVGFKREKLVGKRLKEKGIEAFVPLMKKVRRYERKVRTVELPLISCYVFVKITKAQYVPVLDTPDVYKFITFRRDLIAISEEEMYTLKRIVQADDINVEVLDTSEIFPGTEVELMEGQLVGLQGMVVELRNKQMLLVELQAIGQTLAIEVPLHAVRPITVPV